MSVEAILPVFLFFACALGLAIALLAISLLCNPRRPGPGKRMPYESGMDPVHDTRRRFDVRFHLMAIAFLVFDVEVLFLYPWAVAMHPAGDCPNFRGHHRVARPCMAWCPDENGTVPFTQANGIETAGAGPAVVGIDAAVAGGLVASRDLVFAGAMVFIALLTAGFVYDWRKGIFRWR
jgi:NADH-quinone oxidoreductase subunit A